MEEKYWKVVKAITWNRIKTKYVKAFYAEEAKNKTRWNKSDIIKCIEITKEEFESLKKKIKR